MCYAKPGPRCYGHASEKVANTKAKLETAQQKLETIKDQMQVLEKKHPKNHESRSDYTELRKKKGTAEAKVNYLKRCFRDDQMEADTTTQGIEELKSRIFSLNPAIAEQDAQIVGLTARLKLAENSYKHKLLSYDYERGTVNGRNPSPYGSAGGIMILAKRKRALQEKAEKAEGEEKEKYDKRISDLTEQIDHAKATKDHTQSHITDYSSATLAENKEKYKKAVPELNKARAAYKEGEERYRSEYIVPMQKMISDQKEAGLGARSKWASKDKTAYRNMEAAAEEMWDKEVKPYSYRVRQIEGQMDSLKKHIAEGSISAKQRYKNRQAKR
jgi:chromosome segregation ATPase